MRRALNKDLDRQAVSNFRLPDSRSGKLPKFQSLKSIAEEDSVASPAHEQDQLLAFNRQSAQSTLQKTVTVRSNEILKNKPGETSQLSFFDKIASFFWSSP
jgi:hypothetical protein